MSRNVDIVGRIMSNREDSELFKTVLYTADGLPVFEILKERDETGDGIHFVFRMNGVRNPYATQEDVEAAISQLGTVFRYKGSKATISELPESGNEPGDVWYVTATDAEYVWIIEDSTGVWEEFGPAIDNVYARGTGHDSAVLKATPNQADPSVERTNTVTGDFSVVIAGSRNNISATESAAAGGIINISGGGNNFGSGYRQTLTDCENSMSNGYRNTLDSCAQVKALGRGLNLTYCSNGIFAGYDITCTGTGAEKREGNALFGRDVSSIGSYGLSAGLHIHISNSCAAAIGDNLLTSKYGQTNVGMWNKANNQAYFVVGSGQSETARKNCFAAGWYSEGATEEDRRVIWIGDTMLSEKQLKALLAIISN